MMEQADKLLEVTDLVLQHEYAGRTRDPDLR